MIQTSSKSGAADSGVHPLVDALAERIRLCRADLAGLEPLAIADDLEAISGSQGNDTLTGDGGPNRIDGNDGHDTITGLGGADTLNGGTGSDTLDGGSGGDVVLVADPQTTTLLSYHHSPHRSAGNGGFGMGDSFASLAREGDSRWADRL